MKKKYEEEATEPTATTSTMVSGSGDFIKIGETDIELYPGDKIQDNGPALVFFNGPDREATDSFGGVRPHVDRESFEKFKAMDKSSMVSTGIWIYK